MSIDIDIAEQVVSEEERFVRASERFWHPVIRSVDLPPGRVASTTLLGRRLAVWRALDGSVAASDGVCAHRGAHLGDGEVTASGCLRCPYHGWEYAADGRCTLIPQTPRAPIPPRARVDGHRCVEVADLVWVWLSDEEPTSRPEVPESTIAGWDLVLAPPFTWEANALLEVENYCDMAHFSILHARTFGDTDHPEVAPYSVETSPDASLLEWRFDYTMVDRRSEPWTETPTSWIYRIRPPFTCSIELRDPDTHELRRVFVNFAVPTDLHQTKIFYGAMFRHGTSDEDIEASFANSMAIFEEDRTIVERQHPRLLNLDRGDFHAPFDRYSVAYRRALTTLSF
jgi:vanillate O-demethylase monooxygenase subunit